MNRTLKLAFAAALGLAILTPAMAQNFPDVPDNHWAYEAIENLKNEGILVGYPDGFYRGARPLSRYELAIALNAAYQVLNDRLSGLEDQIAAIEEQIEGAPTAADLQELRDRLGDLKGRLDTVESWGPMIEDLQRMADEFAAELESLGTDVDELKDGLSSLEARVDALEKKKPTVEITGDVNLLVLAGHSTDNRFGILPDGRTVGVGRGDLAGLPAGFTEDLSILHEANLKFAGTNETGPKWYAVLNVGNVLGNAGNLNALGGGAFTDTADTDVYFQEFGVSFDTALLGQGFSAQIGRLPLMVGDYLLARPDYTTWYDSAYYDNGAYYTDGAVLSFNFGPAKLSVFGGRNSGRNTTNGVDINPIPFGASTIDQSLGVTLDIPISDLGGVKLAYLWHDSNTGLGAIPAVGLAAGANRVNVYGAEVDLTFDRINFDGKVAVSTLSQNTSNRLDDENLAWDAGLSYAADNFEVGVGYRRIEGNFAAAGSWGRLGTFWNPTNVEGFNAHLKFMPTKNLSLYAKGEFVEGIDAAGTVLRSATLTSSDDINSIKVGLDYSFDEFWGVGASYEDVRFNYSAGGDPTQRWYTVAFNYNISDRSSLKLMYVYSDIDNKLRIGGTPLAPANRYTGGLLGTQLTLKF